MIAVPHDDSLAPAKSATGADQQPWSEAGPRSPARCPPC